MLELFVAPEYLAFDADLSERSDDAVGTAPRELRRRIAHREHLDDRLVLLDIGGQRVLE